MSWSDWAIGPGEPAYRFQLKRLVPLLPSAGRVLDVGCGNGRYCRDLVARGCRTWGVDVSDSNIADARRVSPHTWFAVAHAAQLPFASASFDAVVSIMMLQEAQDIRPALTEMRRVCRPGAVLVIAVSHPFSTLLDREPDGRLVVARHYDSVEPYMRVAQRDGRRICFRGYQHPISRYLTTLRDVGFRLTELDEVAWGSTAEWAKAPRYLHLLAEAE